MENCFEIFWDDLKESTQQSLIRQGFVYDDNMDIFPIAFLSQEEEENNEE